MRKITYMRFWFVGMVAFALLGVSCIKDDLDAFTYVEEGHPITVKMTMGLSKSADISITRADHSYSGLSTLTLFIYNADGTSCEQVLTLENGDGGLTFLGNTTGPNGERLYQLSFQTTSGEKKLLGVANYSTGNSGFWSGFTSVKDDALAKKLSFADLLSSLISLRDGLVGENGLILPSITASSQMVISGWNEGVVFDTNGTVTNCGTYGDEEHGILLKMDRAMARITFKISALSTTKMVGGVNHTVTFSPSTYKVYNIPKKALLVKPVSNVSGASFYTVDYLADEEFLTSATTNVPAVSGGNYTFTFYMPENVQVEKTQNSEGGEMTYVDRDKWKGTPGSSPEMKVWTNAPEHSTFVVINGTYTEEKDGQPYYTGTVNYTIHLGDFSSGEGATGSMGNFSVERNYSYTYTMSVLGADNIVVEAEVNGPGNQPGAEGDIYDADNCVYNYQLDAHFEQVYLQYDLSSVAEAVKTSLAQITSSPTDKQIDDAISSKLILVIQSEAMDHNSNGVVNKRGSLQPYQIYADAVRNAADPAAAAAAAKAEILDDDPSNVGVGEITPKKGFDYKWIEFWPQIGTTLASYPGTPDWSLAYIDGITNATGNDEYLMDVYDVIVAMGKVVRKIYNGDTPSTTEYGEDGITVTRDNGNYVARFTAFVNEYYYYSHPLTGTALSTWSVITNKIPREMIIAMSTNVSTDGNSSYSQIHSYISQLSMQTFYSSRTEQINAFGLETYNETPLAMPLTPPGSGNTYFDYALSDTYGRQNQIRLISKQGNATSLSGTLNWNDYITDSKNGWSSTIPTDRTARKLPDAYVQSNVAYACLSRNRDLNGNGKIDDNELRWYLPSLNEYIRIGIGNNVLSNASRLYMGDKMAMQGGDYYPRSYIKDGALYHTSSEYNKRVFWAVEHGAYGNNGSYNQLPIRCVRVLPAIADGQDVTTLAVEPASTFEKFTDGQNVILKFRGRLVDELYRERTADVLMEHSEDESPNSFYDGIIVSRSYMGTTFPLTQIVNDGGNQNNPCATYSESGDGGATWRVPNLVELQALNAAGDLLDAPAGNSFSEYTVCCTQFSNPNVRYGFMYNGMIACMQYSERTQSSKVRCVRDVPAGYDFSKLTPMN